jgi:hypothetical protein
VADTLTTQTSTLATVPGGSVIATDDAGASGHVQVVKLALSADGSATPITADANGLEVQGAGIAGTPAGGVVSVQGVASGTVLPVSDNGGSLTVDGTVAVSGTVTVDGSAVTQPVSAASLPLPSGASTLAEQQSQTTALQLLDDAVYTDGTGTPSKAIGIAGTDGTNPQIVKTDAAGELQVDVLSMPTTTVTGTVTANAGTGPFPVSDNAGSLTVDNGGTFAVQESGAALTALQVLDDTVLTEDAAHSTGDKGVMALAVRRDADTTLVDTTGDYAPLQVNAAGSLKVAIISGGGSGGTSATDDAAFTPASGSGTPIMGFADETAPDSVDEGDVGVVRMTLTRALHVNLRDAAGAEVAVGGGTQYTEDAAAAANPVGTALNLVRDDARGGSLTTTDGDNVAARGTNAGELYVKHVDSIPVTDNSGSLTVDNAALAVTGGGVEATALRVTVASDSTGVLSVDDNGSTLSVDDGAGSLTVDNAALAVTGGGVEATALRVTIASDSTGVLSVDDNGGSLTVDGTVTATLSATTNAGATVKTADYDTGAGTDTVTMVGVALPASGGAVAGGTSTNPLRIDPTGSTTQPISAASLPLPSGASTAAKQPALGTAGTASTDVITVQGIASMTALVVDGSAVTQPVSGTVSVTDGLNIEGDVASDAVDSGNPVKVGALAKSGDITAVADADRVNLIATLLGKLVSVPYATPAKTWSYPAAAGGLVNTTGVTAKAAAGAGIRNYVTRAQVINSHQTTSTEVVIRDGAAGTVLWRGWAQAAGGGATVQFDPPLRGTANTLVEIAEITTTATAGVLVNLQGFEAAE